MLARPLEQMAYRAYKFIPGHAPAHHDYYSPDRGTRTLEQWTRRGTSEHRLVERARSAPLAHQGHTNQRYWTVRLRGNRSSGANEAPPRNAPDLIRSHIRQSLG